MTSVAAAISVAISHSSRWSRTRLICFSKPQSPTAPKRPGVRSPPADYFCFWQHPPRLHLNGQFLGNQVEHFLTDAAFGPLVGRLHRLLPSGLLLRRQIVKSRLAGLLDGFERVRIFLLRD